MKETCTEVYYMQRYFYCWANS